MSSALIPLAVAIPLLGAAVVAVLGSRAPRAVFSVVGLVAAACSTACCAFVTRAAAAGGTIAYWFGGWRPHHGVALGIVFVADPVNAALATFAALLATAALVFAWTYYDQDDGAFVALMLVFSAAVIAFFLTGDLFNLFVFFELMSVSGYALTGFRTEDSAAVTGAFSFAVINSTGAFLVLIGTALVYARTGALAFAQIAHAVAARPDPLIALAFALLATGYLVKAAIIPFHFWLSEAHAVAPTPLCVLFSGIMVQAGIYAVARLWWSALGTALAPDESALRGLLIAFGLATAVVGAVMCYAQRHFKRLLAFSTISHSGLLLCALALFDRTGLAGAFLYIVGHGLVKGTLFFGSGIILNRYGSIDVEDLRGKLAELPWLPALLALAALGLAGMPPFGIFVGKTLIDRVAETQHAGWLGWALTLTAALTGAGVLGALGRMTFGWGPPPDPNVVVPGETTETAPARGAELVLMAVPTIVLLALAVASGAVAHVVPVVTGAADRFADLAQQEAIVMNGAHAVPLARGESVGLGAGIVQGAFGAALAVALATLGLFAYRIPALWQRLAAIYDAAMNLPHRWHSGLVTDEIAWLAVGAATFGAAVLAIVR